MILTWERWGQFFSYNSYFVINVRSNFLFLFCNTLEESKVWYIKWYLSVLYKTIFLLLIVLFLYRNQIYILHLVYGERPHILVYVVKQKCTTANVVIYSDISLFYYQKFFCWLNFALLPQFRSIIPCAKILYIEVTFWGFIHWYGDFMLRKDPRNTEAPHINI